MVRAGGTGLFQRHHLPRGDLVSVQLVYPKAPTRRRSRAHRQALPSAPRTPWAWNAPRLRRSMSRDVRRSSLCSWSCLLYTSDAADEEDSVDLGGRRIIKKKKKKLKDRELI